MASNNNNNNNKTNLLASLTGDLDAAPPALSGEQDLFGDIPDGEGLFGNISLHDDDDPPLEAAAQTPPPAQVQQTLNGTAVTPTPLVTSNLATPPIAPLVPPPVAPAPAVPAPVTAPVAAAPSLLASSGLLGDDTTATNTALGAASSSSNGGLFDAVDKELEQAKQEQARQLAEQERQKQEQALAQQQELQRQQEQEKLAQQMQQQQAAAQVPGGFYRNHHALQQPPQYNGNLQYSSTGGSVQTHSVSLRPTTTAGMHAAASFSNIRPPSRTIHAPPTLEALPFSNITVSEPMLVASSSGGFGALLLGSPPHWSYQVETCLKEGGGTWLVRRRFRHVVALEDRLRAECPGSILPARPDKHATRAIEEASTSQSAEFALQRAQEIQIYLNELAQHPIASNSNVLRLFLALQDDMGTAWPEVSSNAFTRLGAVGAGAASVLAESTSGALPSSLKMESIYEDNAELLALSSSEELRMGAVTQAVPKLEGSVTLLREHGESCGAVGMELSKLTKEVETTDAELGQPLAVLSSGLLRAGRREKRLAMELSAAMSSFVTQYKLCKNERLAFQDRRYALQRCQKERSKADERAQKLLLNPSGDPDRIEREAVMGDTLAVDAVRQADEIGRVLKEEVNRVAYGRRTEWSKSMKVVASATKEASTEKVAIWESTRESFLQAFPDMAASDDASVASGRTA